MKKFTKVVLSCAIVSGLAGMGLSAAGIAMGGAVLGKDVLAKALDERLSTENIRWSVSVLNHEDDWDDLDWDDEERKWEDSAASHEENGVQVYEFDVFKNLDIELSADELHLKQYNGDEIRIEVENNDDKVRVRTEGDTLKIKSLTQMNGTEVIVYYPEKQEFHEVDIEVDAGAIYMDDDFHAHDLEIQVGAGNMISKGNVSAREISMDVGTGEVEMHSVEASSVDAECGIGKLTIKLSGTEADYRYEVECGLGSVTIGDETYSGISEKKKAANADASRNLEVECGLGEVNISFGA